MAEESVLYRAVDLARRAHKGQFRKYGDNVPYIVHPAEVAAYTELLNQYVHEVPEYVVAAAWLHDVLEDCDQKFVDELLTFPEEVVNLVKELTNPSKGSKAPRKIRKQMDRDHLKGVSTWAKKIKLIDRTVNLKDCKDAPQDFKQLYAHESELLLETLKGTDALLEKELQAAIERLKVSSTV